MAGNLTSQKKIPGKEEFYETLRYYNNKIELTGVNLKLNTDIDAQSLIDQKYDEVVLATGIKPRELDIEGADHPKVLSYIDVVVHQKPVGKKVAIIGAGGIGFDLAEYLVHEGESPALNVNLFNKEWGIDDDYENAGGFELPEPSAPARQITLLQRKTSKLGKGLGKTTGWIHRAALAMKQVRMIGGVSYDRIDDQGLHITVAGQAPQIIECDTIVVCAGQLSLKDLYDDLDSAAINTHLIGGSKLAGELDAKRAIREGFEVASMI